MSADTYYIEKELSWLSFNERVLQEAADKSVPIIERVRFLGIFSNNLDEFYQVRFADVKRHVLISHRQINQKSNKLALPYHDDHEHAKVLLRKIQDKVCALNKDFDLIYNDILIAMARRNIFLINENQLSEDQTIWLKKYFIRDILPYITPIIINDDMDLLSFLKDAYSYLAVELKKTEQPTCYALIEIPTDDIVRFVKLPTTKGNRQKKTLILLDNIIRLCLDEIFNGLFDYDTIDAYAIKMTRDAEYYLTFEVEHSLLAIMSGCLEQRLTALPVRFIYQNDMPQQMIDKLTKILKISNYDSLLSGARYHNFKDFIGFPNVGMKSLEHPKLPAIESADFTHFNNAFEAIAFRDILLHYPYHTFQHMTEWVRQASFDPKVFQIRINIYRVAKNSRIINSMIDAANNGKSVTVIVELQARFDEEANIEWSRILTDAGVKVIFGAPGLKIHCKLCLISRYEQGQKKQYAHIGTGNFHEKTAQIYTDLSLFTANETICNEVGQVFDFIENPYKPVKFANLIVSPRNSRARLYQLIEKEISYAHANKKSGITLKVNNLVDSGLIDMLYKASCAGVKIRLIVRGMCSLMAGIKGISEHIEAISIVDRYLEHARVFIFENNEQPKIYLSSADWMTRNIDNRIEVATPIEDPRIKKQIIDIIELQWADRTKARYLDKDMTNQYVKRGNGKKYRSQIEIYNYLKQIECNEIRQTHKQTINDPLKEHS